MFGLIRRKHYDDMRDRLIRKNLENEASKIRISELEAKLKLETSKSAYWQIKYQHPTTDILVAGTKEEIEYITTSLNDKN